jgi:hypothetical protein
MLGQPLKTASATRSGGQPITLTAPLTFIQGRPANAPNFTMCELEAFPPVIERLERLGATVASRS